MASSHPLIDSHIHLFPTSELSTLAWCSPSNPLYAQHSLEEYTAAVATPPATPLRGFVFVETDRICHLDSDEGWKYPLEELDWILRIARGTPGVGEGHTEVQKDLCLAAVPWAPIPRGREAVERYVRAVRDKAGKEGHIVAGFRYLVQDKPLGTMLTEDFIEGLKYLGEQGYCFDLGIDFHRGGGQQMEEAVEMLARVSTGVEEGKKVRVVINHMCKPDLTQDIDRTSGFNIWATNLQQLASFPNAYMKISGAFSEMEPLPSAQDQEKMGFWTRHHWLMDMAKRLYPWMSLVIQKFGAERVMYGSDWPVCNIQGGGNTVAWRNWHAIVEAQLSKELNETEQAAIWGGTAAKVYKIT